MNIWDEGNLNIDRRHFCLWTSALLAVPQLGIGSSPRPTADRLALAIQNLAALLRAEISPAEIAWVTHHAAVAVGAGSAKLCETMVRKRASYFTERVRDHIRCDFRANRCYKVRNITMSRTEVGLILLLDEATTREAHSR